MADENDKKDDDEKDGKAEGKGASSGNDTRTETDSKDDKSKDEEKSKDEKDAPKYTDAQVQDIVRKRLADEKAAEVKRAEKAKKEAEDRALVEAGKFQQLADERGKEVERLAKEAERIKPLEDQVASLDAALKGQLKVLREKLPKDIIELLDELDPVKQLNWLNRNPRAGAGDDDKKGDDKKGDDRSRKDATRRDADRKTTPARKGEGQDGDDIPRVPRPTVRF